MTRTHRLIVRLTDAEMASLRARADGAGATVSAYVRASALGETAGPRPVAPALAEGHPDGDAPPAWADSDPRRLLRERDRQARAVLARANRGR